MRELKEILFNPAILSLIVLVGGTFFLILFNFALKAKFARKLETLMVFLYLLLMMELRIFPFSVLKPLALVEKDKTLGSAAAQLGVYLFFVLVLSSRFRDFFQNSLLVFKNPGLTVVLLLSALSGFWSETPELSFKGGIAMVVVSLFTAHIAKHYKLQELMALFRWVSICTILPSIVVSIAIPSFGFDYDKGGWIGLLRHPIALGTFSALSIVLWFCHLSSTKQQRSLCIAMIVSSTVTLVGAKSAQGFFILVVLMSILAIRQVLQRLKFRQSVLLSILLAIAGTAGTVFFWLNIDTIFAANGRDLTLTGRTEFWPQIINALHNHNPFLGYGFRGFWQDWRRAENPARSIINANGFVPPNAHNGFIDLAVQIGYIGLFAFLVSTIAIAIRSFVFAARQRTTTSIVPLILTVYIVLANFSETQIFTDVYVWFLYIYLAVSPELDISTTAARSRAQPIVKPELIH
jgi:exopolysaccharide production protein ExoQ